MLTAADIRVINDTAARRFAGGIGEVDDAALAAVTSEQDADATPFVRAAVLAAGLLARGVVSAAPLHTALLVVHCSLSLDGFLLLAPQGVAAGMIRSLAAGADPAGMARWLEDRAVPSSAD